MEQGIKNYIPLDYSSKALKAIRSTSIEGPKTDGGSGTL